MTYKEIKDRLTKCEKSLLKIKASSSTTPLSKKAEEQVVKLELLKESLTKQLAEAQSKTYLVTPKSGQTTAVSMSDDETDALKDADDVKAIKGIDGEEIKEDQGTIYSVEDTKGIAKKVGLACAKALKSLGDEIAHMKAKHIEENSFEIHVEYKKDGKDDTFAFHIQNDNLHLADFSFNKVMGQVGTKPSGEAIVQVDVIANELQKHWKSMQEGMSDEEWADAKEKERLEKHPERDIIRKIQGLVAKEKAKKLKEITKEGEGDDHHYIKVSRKDYKKTMSILDTNVDPTYVKTEVVDDDGAGNVIIYFVFRHEYGFDDMYDDPEGKENPEFYQEPDEDPHGFMYDVVMDLQAHGIEVVDHSAELDENVTQKHIDDIEGSGNIDIAYKKAMELLKSLLTKDEALDHNDPVLMRARVAKMRADDMKKLDALKKANRGSSRKEEKARELVRKLKIKRAEIEREMENDPDIEPQGGPVADMYGDQLNKIDNAIEKAASVYNKPMDYDTAVGLKENQPTVFDDESFDALRDIILKYVEDPDDAEKLVQQVDDHGLDSLPSDIEAQLERDPEFEAWYDKLHNGPSADTDYMQRRKADDDYMEEGDVDTQVDGGDIDVGHQDDEPHMLKKDLYDVITYASKLYKALDKYDNAKGEVDFPHWWQKKVTLAREYMSSAQHYLEGEEKQPAIDQLALESVIMSRGLVKEATDLYDRNGIQITRFSGGKRGLMLQVNYGGKYIHVPASEYPFLVRAMQSVQGDVKDMSRQYPRKKNMEEGVAKIQKAHGLVVAKMKELAKQYKGGDESVVGQLKDLTAKKKALEAQLEKAVSDKGRGQELDPNINEVTDDQVQDAIQELRDLIDEIEAKGEEAREVVRQVFPNELSRLDAYGAFNNMYSGNRYDVTLGGFVDRLEEEGYEIEDGEVFTNEEELTEEIDGGRLFDYFKSKGYDITERRPDGYPPKEGVEGYMVSRGEGRSPQSVIFQHNKDTDEFTISRMSGYRIDQDAASKAGMKEAGRSGVAGIDSYMTDGNYTPVGISAEGLKDIVDHVMTGLDREAKAQSDFYKGRGKTSGTIDEGATCCGKCGRVHVKGSGCKRPYLKGKKHCRTK